MKKQAIAAIIFTFLSALIVVETYVIIRQAKTARDFRKEVPLLLKGEKITYFDMMDADGKTIDSSTLEKNPLSLVYIFDRPCSRCNKNIDYWKKIRSLADNRLPVHAVVLDNYSEMLELHKSGFLNFKLYTPVDKERFTRAMRIKLNLAQTIVLERGTVQSVKLGLLSHEDFMEIVTMIKRTGRFKKQ